MNQYKTHFKNLFKGQDIHNIQKTYDKYQSLSKNVEEMKGASVFFSFFGILLTFLPILLLIKNFSPSNLTVFLFIFSFFVIYLIYQLINLYKEKETFLLSRFKNYKKYLLNKKKYLQQREQIKFIFNNQENQYLIYCYLEELEPNLNPNYSITSELKCLKNNMKNNNIDNIIDITFKIQSIILAEKNSLENKLINFKQHYEHY